MITFYLLLCMSCFLLLIFYFISVGMCDLYGTGSGYNLHIWPQLLFGVCTGNGKLS